MLVKIRLVLLVVAVLAISGCAQVVATEKHEAARTEPIAGSDLKRVVLTEKASERQGIETVALESETMVRKHTLGGQVVDAQKSGEVQVRVELSEGDRKRLDLAGSVQVRRLGEKASEATLQAQADTTIPVSDSAVDANMVHFAISSAGHGLKAGEPVFVEVAAAGGSAQRKIVPFSALIYGLEGDTWVYTQVAPHVFVRHSASVDYIEGDRAILLEGPQVGTKIVTVGATELFGVESGVGGGH